MTLALAALRHGRLPSWADSHRQHAAQRLHAAGRLHEAEQLEHLGVFAPKASD